MNNIWSVIARVCIVLVVGLGSIFLLNLSLRGVSKRLEKSGASGEHLKRLATLVQAWRSIGQVIIALIVLLMILRELGIDITPILASAGVIGLAFSLGTQTVIKDILGGIVILSENQFAIGDVISVGTITGTVERITLRATYLRDVEGKLILIPNGDVRTLSNLTTQWAQVVVTFSFDYEADMGKVVRALEDAIQLAQADKEITSSILEAPHAFGWTGFTDWAVQAQIIVKTQPGKQWLVARALRKAALERLQAEKVELALPRQRMEAPRSIPSSGRE
jgi:moderate conductance mechanosensitive channel